MLFPSKASLIILCFLLLAIVDYGLFSGYDAFLAALFLVKVFPPFLPYALIILAFIQDAPGHAGASWYLSVTVLGIFFIFRVISRKHGRKVISGEIYKWYFGAASVIFWGFTVSVVNHYLGGHLQSPDRNMFILAGLMTIIPYIGLLYGRALVEGVVDKNVFHYVILILLFHSLFVAFGQALIDPFFLFSDYGIEATRDAAQISQKSVLGLPRITSSALSPNAFALITLLLLILMRPTFSDKKLDKKFLLFFFIVSLIVGFLTLSKAVIAAFFLVGLFLLWQTLGAKLSLSLIILGIISFSFFLGKYIDEVSLVLRLSNEIDGQSFRALAWSSVLENLTILDYILGTGLSHWKVFFGDKIGVALADPHTWVLSLPGTFGLPGLLFFLAVQASLLSIAFQHQGNLKFLATTMLCIFLFKDLFSISYLFGNTPITFMLWLVLGSIWVSRSALKNSR